MIIGLTGSMGCGKGEVVKVLEKMGFKYVTLSAMVHEEARRLGVEEEREKMMAVGNALRAAEGAGVLAKRSLKKIEKSGYDKWVVDGIRNPAEIDALREGKDVHIVGVSANRELLVQRILDRGRKSDANDREAIIHKLEREWGVGEPAEGQQVGECMKKVDIVIENEGTLEELDQKFVDFYKKMANQ